jgi:hypothetical protein
LMNNQETKHDGEQKRVWTAATNVDISFEV